MKRYVVECKETHLVPVYYHVLAESEQEAAKLFEAGNYDPDRVEFIENDPGYEYEALSREEVTRVMSAREYEKESGKAK